MKTIELACPGCEARLTLDAGFAGGVCRCSNCGTLMTVPTDPESEAAERLVRPDAPGSSDSPAPPDRREAPDQPASPQAAKPAKAAGSGGEDDGGGGDAETYTTASGKTVRVGPADRVPIAHGKRVAVRVTTAVVFLGLVAALLAACVVAIVVLLRASGGGGGQAPATPPIQPFAYSSGVNPYLLNRPNALGMPLSKRTAVVVEASAKSKPWLALAGRALRRGLTQPGRGAQVDLIYAAAKGPIALGPTPLTRLDARAIARFQKRVEAAGQADLVSAVNRAMSDRPTSLVLVVGQRTRGPRLDALRRAIEQSKGGLKVSVLAINADARELEDLASAHDGAYAYLTDRQLQSWAAAASP